MQWCANAVAVATNRIFSSATRFGGSNGRVLIVYSGTNGDTNEVDNVRRIIHFECFARIWMEQKYSNYLNTIRKWPNDNVWWIYDTPESSQKAQENIDNMLKIMQEL